MKNLLILILFVGVMFSACTSEQSSKTTPSSRPPVATGDGDEAAIAKIPRIRVAEADALVKTGQAIIIDVRQAPAYQTAHIKGAMSIPEANLAGRMATLPKDKKIITYCT